MTFPDSYGNQKPLLSCGWNCFERAVRYQMSRGQTVVPWGPGYAFHGMALAPEAAWRSNRIQVEHLIVAGRYEDAAILYEKLGMWKEAGELRSRGRRQVVTQVHVNVNDLVDQLKKAGISTDYMCPACGGHIRISGDTSMARLSSCEFCGSVIQTTDLVDFLTKVVGYR